MSGAANLSELLSTRFRFNSFDLFRSRQGIGNAVYLVNGRPVSGGYLSMIPLSAVERVEVLDEGPIRQSSFGIAITVNIVLRKDFEGFEVTARSGLPSPEGHGFAQRVRLLGRHAGTRPPDHRRHEFRA